MPRFLLGIDVGTAGSKAAIYDLQGRRIGGGFEPSRLHQPRPGWVYQDLNEMYVQTTQAISRCLDASGVPASSIAGLAIDGQMAGICAIDRDWRPATHYDSWLDNRCGSYIDRMKEHQQRIIELTGGYPTYSHGPKILWWKHEQPEAFERIHKFIMPAAYVAGRLAGLSGDDAYIDYTYLHFSCLSDARATSWSRELCDLFEVPIEKLPRIVAPWEVIGHVTADAAQATGLEEGTPIAAGAGDTTSSLLGSATVRPGLALDVAGSASVFATCISEFRPDVNSQTLFTARHVAEDLWYALAYVNGGGLNLQWFRDTFGTHEVAEATRSGGSAYHLLDTAAAKIPPGSEGLLFLPHLAGRVSPNDPQQRGLWAGFSWSHNRGHFYRAMLEAIAYEYAHYLRIERGLFPEIAFREVWVMGGGSESRLWNQIKADVLDVTYRALQRQEGATLGSAIVAGRAVGLFDDVREPAERFVSPGPPTTPREEHHRTYRPLVDTYLQALDINHNLSVALTANNSSTQEQLS